MHHVTLFHSRGNDLASLFTRCVFPLKLDIQGYIGWILSAYLAQVREFESSLGNRYRYMKVLAIINKLKISYPIVFFPSSFAKLN